MLVNDISVLTPTFAVLRVIENVKLKVSIINYA